MNQPLTNARALLQAENGGIGALQFQAAVVESGQEVSPSSSVAFPRWLTRDIGSSKVIYLTCEPCDECGADTDTRELCNGICRDCEGE